jgi:stage II sporulation protein R
VFNRVYLYSAFALIMLIMSWEANLASAALLNATIPEQSIRIRILANSDRVEDQWFKKEVRDAITAHVNTWNLSSDNIAEARNEVNRHLPQLRELVGAMLAKYNLAYGYKVELGNVHFPAKIFGQTTYPAGEYEALRVTLGDGEGQNWWCVLFPPLCFGSAIKAAAAKREYWHAFHSTCVRGSRAG